MRMDTHANMTNMTAARCAHVVDRIAEWSSVAIKRSSLSMSPSTILAKTQRERIRGMTYRQARSYVGYLVSATSLYLYILRVSIFIRVDVRFTNGESRSIEVAVMNAVTTAR